MSEPRTVWVTGAASGMGASHARRFGALGDRVACWDRDADGVEAVAAEICSTGGEALPLKCDLRNWEEVAAAADLAEDSLGPPSVVVANAGIILSGEPIEDLAGVLDLASSRQAFDQPERAAQKRPFLVFKTVVAAIPVQQTVAGVVDVADLAAVDVLHLAQRIGSGW